MALRLTSDLGDVMREEESSEFFKDFIFLIESAERMGLFLDTF